MDRELGREFNGSTGCCARIKTYIQILNTQVKCQTWWHTPVTPVLSIKDRWIPVGQEGFLYSQNVSKDKVENKREDTKSHLCWGMLTTFPHTHIHARMHAHKHTCIHTHAHTISWLFEEQGEAWRGWGSSHIVWDTTSEQNPNIARVQLTCFITSLAHFCLCVV